jgi:hypothetical protein
VSHRWPAAEEPATPESSSAEAAEPSTPEPDDTETPSPTPTPSEPAQEAAVVEAAVPRAGQTAEQRTEAEATLLVLTALFDTGQATDAQLVAAAGQACDTFDAGGDMALASAFTVLELPTDLPDEAHYGVAYAAARSLCPEHEAVAQLP